MQNVMENEKSVLSVESFGGLCDAVPEVLYSMMFDGVEKMCYLSKAAEELTGYTIEELLGRQDGWKGIVHPQDQSKYSEMITRCKSERCRFELEYRILHKDGSCCDVLDRGELIDSESGDAVGLNGLIINITTQKQISRELDRAQMLRSIGKLSAGIAHEINTPIQFLGDNMRFLDDSFTQISDLMQMYISLRSSLTQEGSQKELVGKILAKEEDVDIDFLVEEIPQAIEQSQNGIKLVSTIVSAMRDFSHIDDRRKTSADLNKALASTIVILRNELKYVADVIKDFDDNLPEIVCCVDDLHQVFLNLLINAAHSIEERINTGQTQRGEITVKTFQQGSEVIVSVSDTGMGISPEIREKIFEPFFTTKSKDRKGTGQGLAMVMSIVEGKHEGKVELTSEVGVGTTFTIKLPIESSNERQE